MIDQRSRQLYATIEVACKRASRSLDEITVVCVSKTVPVNRIQEAIDAGFANIGENRVQEAQQKKPNLASGSDITWHLIGHLQSNKASIAVGLFDLIQSLDSIKLAEALNRHACNAHNNIRVLLQVNISGEEQKYGFAPEEVIESARLIAKLDHVHIEGLMAMAPFFDDPELARPYFKKMRILFDTIKSKNIPGVQMRHLSMGMSGDYVVAIEEGSTMIRIGTYLFG